MSRHALGCDLSTREPFSTKPEHQFRFDPAYHPNDSFYRVIGHAVEGAYVGGAEAEYSTVSGDTIEAKRWWRSAAILMALREANIQNAERYAHRYTVLDENASNETRQTAAALMDEWTERAEAVPQKYRDDLLEHKDKYSRIIRTAHETRLADARAAGRPAPVSEEIVESDGPSV